MSENYKKRWNYLNYVKHLVLLVSTITGCVSISALASLVYVPVGITNFGVGWKICAITPGVKKYKLIITKRKKRYDKIVLLRKTKLDTIEVLISKVLTNSYVSHDELLSIENVLREYNEMNKEINNFETSVEYFKYGWYKQRNIWNKWHRNNKR